MNAPTVKAAYPGRQKVSMLTDLHSHTLWHLDDGSDSFETSVEMCRTAEATGTNTLFLTPHIVYWDSAEELYDRRNYKTEQLREVLEDEGIDLKLETGFEILCDDDIFDIKYFKPYTLAGTDYILIEFDFYKTREEDVISWCKYLESCGLTPVIAHPERYGFVIEDISALERLTENGVLLQMNGASPLGVFGEAESLVALKMLKSGYVDFLGSDAHSDRRRNTALASMTENYPDTVDRRLLDRILNTNPATLLENKKITPVRFAPISRF